MELEYKFLLSSVSAGNLIANDPLLAPFLGSAARIEMKSVYYDTKDRELSKRKGGLRLRFENGAGVACLKLASREKDGLSKRDEYECPALSVEEGLRILAEQGAPRSLCETLLSKELVPITEVSFLRTARHFENASLSFDFCVDEGLLGSKKTKLPFCELEIELKKGSADKLDLLVREIQRRYRLSAESRSKLLRAIEWDDGGSIRHTSLFERKNTVMEKVAVNPFYVGNEFMNYCIKEGWVSLECTEDKKLHYFVNEAGAAQLKERFGIVFGCTCSLEEQHE